MISARINLLPLCQPSKNAVKIDPYTLNITTPIIVVATIVLLSDQVKSVSGGPSVSDIHLNYALALHAHDFINSLIPAGCNLKIS